MYKKLFCNPIARVCVMAFTASILLFSACSKEEPTETKDFAGDWKLTLSGDINGTMLITNGLDGTVRYIYLRVEYPGASVSYSGTGMVSASGSILIQLSQGATLYVGEIRGTLNSDGTGSGTYTINYSQYVFEGNWTGVPD